jgi:ATP-binding cassette subfamily F protein 3
VVLKVQEVTKSYDEKVLENVSLTIDRGDRTAFVGQNGMGKSTLAKIIIDETEYAGEVDLGHNVDVGYFAQNQAEYLNGEITVLDTMLNAADDTNRIKVRDMLGAFLFRGDDVHKKVKVLSGGERNRLALCKMMLQPFNLLIMDEPTNHLDIQSKNVLKAALLDFAGTLIVVSHDREFLQGLTDLTYEFRDHKVKKFLGGIDYYLEQRAARDMRAIEKVDKPKAISNSNTAKQSEPLDFEEQKKQKSLKNQLSKTESAIAKLEKEIKEMDVDLQVNYDETVGKDNFFDNYQGKKKKLEKLMAQWEELAGQIM